jgi:hypothetical protein
VKSGVASTCINNPNILLKQRILCRNNSGQNKHNLYTLWAAGSWEVTQMMLKKK